MLGDTNTISECRLWGCWFVFGVVLNRVPPICKQKALPPRLTAWFYFLGIVEGKLIGTSFRTHSDQARSRTLNFMDIKRAFLYASKHDSVCFYFSVHALRVSTVKTNP